MMRKIILMMLFLAVGLQAETALRMTPFLQQTGTYFVSDRVTADGYGMGAGVQVEFDRHWFARADASLLWLNGNAGAARLAFGRQRNGHWAPALLASAGLLFGHRTEILFPNGARPVNPVWNAGLRLAPLRFRHGRIVASALEIGYGIGPYNGTCLDVSVLTVGFAW